MGIKAITFDFWSTLFKDVGSTGKERQAWRIEHMAQALRRGGWQGSVDQVGKAIEVASNKGTEVRLKGGVDFTPEEQLELIFRELGVNPQHEITAQVLEAYISATGLFPPDPMPEMVATVRKLSEEFPIGLISNTGITPGNVLSKVLAGAGVLDCFKVLTFSNEVNLVKPNPEIFRLTAKALGVKPEEVLHIGDDYEADIMGINEVGGKGAWLHSGDQGERDRAFVVISQLSELIEIVRRPC